MNTSEDPKTTQKTDNITPENIEMHRTPSVRETIGAGKSQSVMRSLFGILMIVLYVGVGVLLLINFFKWTESWDACRYIIGVVLIIYGFWRAYRQFKGIDSQI